MDQYPTEEDEYEMMYQDEMEALNEMDHEINVLTPQPCTSKSLRQAIPSTSTFNSQSTLKSPQLSQIPYENNSQQQQQQQQQQQKLNLPLNRKLFGTPIDQNDKIQEKKRVTSTPFGKNQNVQQSVDKQNPIIIPDDIDEPSNVNCLQELQTMNTKNRKRRLEDLFGDIHDIVDDDDDNDNINNFNSNGNDAKKQKSEMERDLEMIEKILEARRKYKEIQNPLKKDNIAKLNALHDFKMKNLSYTVPKYPFIALERSDGERVYVRYHSEEFEKKQIDEINFTFSKKNGSLFGDAQEEIWNQAREITLKRMTSQTAEASTSAEVVEIPIESVNKNRPEVLWVEKYKPRKYIDLLSDETTNRSLLLWLKMWDKVVFGKDFRAKEIKANKLNTFNKRTKKFESTGGWNRRFKQSLNTDCDEYGRPIQKIALLCGPPGLGKTTLAHTIAQHAGYNVRELNASDDRNPDAFRLTLENGTQMSSVLNEEKKPNCLILDEIDGAPQQSIDFLIKFVTDSAVTKAKKGNTSHKNILKRPIICICNDMYMPALRQLRQIAFVVNFPSIESSRLAERLLEISRKERLDTDLGTLLALAEKSGNDIRSCISMMQFFNSKAKKLTLEDVLNSNFGQKDRHRGLFDVWNAIFQIQRPRRQIIQTNNQSGQQNIVGMSDMSISTRVKHILEVVHSAGDYERLMQGVFENYLSQKMPDPNMNGIVEATQWFCFSDEIQYVIHRQQFWTIQSYLQYGFVIWHLLFAGLSWPKISFPNRAFEFNQKNATQKMIFQAFCHGIDCSLIGIGKGHTILLETIPLLKRILSPVLRSVSLQLLTPKERTDLTHTVQVMADLGLTFTQLKAADGTYQYQMEPDLDLLCQFPGYPGVTLLYFARQLIAREVELEIMRRSAPKLQKENKIPKIQKEKNNKITISKTKSTSNVSPESLPNHLQSLKPKIRHGNIKETISKDFFGRVTTKETVLTVHEGGTDVIVKSPIWYRYKEGFNNAVRKDVTMSDLL